jgi:curved DNA-binding protein CbpA
VTRDPYRILGIEPSASSEELHDAYRELVKRHHPDRNGGSAESTRRFQDIQAAYEEVGRLRARGPGPAPPRAQAPRPPDASVEARIADLEREVREAQAARDAALKAARDAVREAPARASDEELGYVTTDDSFGQIISDIADELADGLAGARRHPSVQRLADLIDRLDD